MTDEEGGGRLLSRFPSQSLRLSTLSTSSENSGHIVLHHYESYAGLQIVVKYSLYINIEERGRHSMYSMCDFISHLSALRLASISNHCLVHSVHRQSRHPRTK